MRYDNWGALWEHVPKWNWHRPLGFFISASSLSRYWWLVFLYLWVYQRQNVSAKQSDFNLASVGPPWHTPPPDLQGPRMRSIFAVKRPHISSVAHVFASVWIFRQPLYQTFSYRSLASVIVSRSGGGSSPSKQALGSPSGNRFRGSHSLSLCSRLELRRCFVSLWPVGGFGGFYRVSSTVHDVCPWLCVLIYIYYIILCQTFIMIKTYPKKRKDRFILVPWQSNTISSHVFLKRYLL